MLHIITIDKDKISKEVFMKYEKVRKSGKTNMYDLRRASKLTDLMIDMIVAIQKNYSYLKKKYEQ